MIVNNVNLSIHNRTLLMFMINIESLCFSFSDLSKSPECGIAWPVVRSAVPAMAAVKSEI